jgi:tripartite-type tricarboxylate transporter receptor subunit TctC
MNGVLGTKYRIISGYPGGNEINLAMERGEVQGRCGWSWSSVKSTRWNWYTEKQVHVLIQLSLEKHEDLPNVPLITDLADTPDEKAILSLIFARQALGRPFLAPPDVPQERVAALRKAFMATMSDPQFKADAEKAKLEINPISGEAVQKIMASAAKTDPKTLKKAQDMLKVEKKQKKKS